jgi:hypothetical protein
VIARFVQSARLRGEPGVLGGGFITARVKRGVRARRSDRLLPAFLSVRIQTCCLRVAVRENLRIVSAACVRFAASRGTLWCAGGGKTVPKGTGWIFGWNCDAASPCAIKFQRGRLCLPTQCNPASEMPQRARSRRTNRDLRHAIVPLPEEETSKPSGRSRRRRIGRWRPLWRESGRRCGAAGRGGRYLFRRATCR